MTNPEIILRARELLMSAASLLDPDSEPDWADVDAAVDDAERAVRLLRKYDFNEEEGS